MKKDILLVLFIFIGFTFSCGQSESETDTQTKNFDTSLDTSSVQLQKATARDVLNTVQQSDGSITLVNVWATWCQPCREEFPDLLKLRDDYKEKGLKLIFVSADFEGDTPQVKQFLAEHNVGFKTYLKTGKDMEFINTLHREWSGALPATLIYGPNGQLQDFWQGKASYGQLEDSIKPYVQ